MFLGAEPRAFGARLRPQTPSVTLTQSPGVLIFTPAAARKQGYPNHPR